MPFPRKRSGSHKCNSCRLGHSTFKLCNRHMSTHRLTINSSKICRPLTMQINPIIRIIQNNNNKKQYKKRKSSRTSTLRAKLNDKKITEPLDVEPWSPGGGVEKFTLSHRPRTQLRDTVCRSRNTTKLRSRTGTNASAPRSMEPAVRAQTH